MALSDGDCRTNGIYWLIEATEWIASAYGKETQSKDC